MLQPANLDCLCHSVVKVAEDHCPTALAQAKEIEKQFHTVFTLFGECHKLYDGKAITDQEIDTLSKPLNKPTSYQITPYILETKIKDFMASYRSMFPWATVLPKMHFLEEHVVPWLRRWHVGFGLMGEQGAESIHAYFNSLKRTYQGVPDRVKRLNQMMREHLLHIAPSNIAAKPAIKKRKSKESDASPLPQPHASVTPGLHTLPGPSPIS